MDTTLLNPRIDRRVLLQTLISSIAAPHFAAPRPTRQAKFRNEILETRLTIGRLSLGSTEDRVLRNAVWSEWSGTEMDLSNSLPAPTRFSSLTVESDCHTGDALEAFRVFTRVSIDALRVPISERVFRHFVHEIPFLHPDDLQGMIIADQQYLTSPGRPRVRLQSDNLELIRDVNVQVRFRLGYFFEPGMFGLFPSRNTPTVTEAVRPLIAEASGFDPGADLTCAWCGTVRLTPVVPCSRGVDPDNPLRAYNLEGLPLSRHSPTAGGDGVPVPYHLLRFGETCLYEIES